MIDYFKGKYFHELTEIEMGELLTLKPKLGWIIKHMKQPGWCTYPEALGGPMGCWSLTDCHGLRKRISLEFCGKDCECFKIVK